MNNQSWNLYLDDQAYDPETPDRHAPPDFVVACTSAEAIVLIDTSGPPAFIDFDHDLGTLPDGTVDTVMPVINHLIDNYYDYHVGYRIHSKNPIGTKNIISKMESWKRSKGL